MKASAVVMVVLSTFVLAGATAEPIKPLVVFGDAIGWTVQGSAAAQQTTGGRSLQAKSLGDYSSCSPSEKQVAEACLSAANARFNLTATHCEYDNRVAGCILQASCINLVTPELQAAVKKDKICALSDSDRKSFIASGIAKYQSTCPGVDIENIKLYGIKQVDAVCGGSTDVVAIVGISAAVVLVLAVAFCVYKNKKDARAASSESKAGRAVVVGIVV
jgi:hypothetical protein